MTMRPHASALLVAAQDSGSAATDDALLLRDLLALFDDEHPTQPLVSPASSSSDASGHGAGPPPMQAKPVSRKWSLKLTLDGLRVETQQLTAQLEMLRRDTIGTTDEAQEAALTARYKRRKAEHARQQLRDALAASALFLRGLQTSVLCAPPSFATGATLCRQLHNYTRLPRDRALRWRELAAMGHELHWRRAMDIVDRETQALTSDEDTDHDDVSLRTPRIGVHASSSRSGFCVTTTSAFAVDTTDVGAVLRGASVAVAASGSMCRSYACAAAKQLDVDLEASVVVPNMVYRVTGVRQQSRSDGDDRALLLESRSVTMSKQTDDWAIVWWDYIDEDALHATDDTADISKQAIGACLIRREICADGVERSVCRMMSTRRYHFLPRCSRESLENYERASAPRDHELLVHGVLLEAIRQEESVCAR